jgi:hypothetical protein
MFLLLIVIIVRDVEEEFLGDGSSRKKAKRRKGTGDRPVGENNGGAGGRVGHSEERYVELGQIFALSRRREERRASRCDDE